MSAENTWCEVLGIEIPRLEAVRGHREANTYSLLLVALLERGEPVRLEEVAARFEEAGISPAPRALTSLKRCRPGRAPIYRDGDLYGLDPHDESADLWAFRLGLRPPRGHLRLVTSEPKPAPEPEPEPLPSPNEPLTAFAIDEAWRRGVPRGWSAQRIAVCVMDAFGRTVRPEEVMQFVATIDKGTVLRPDSAKHWHRGSPIHVREDGKWELDPTHDAVGSARKALRDLLAQVRRPGRQRIDSDAVLAEMELSRKRREIRGRGLARLRRVLIHGFPAHRPELLVLLDIGKREIETYPGDDLGAAREKLTEFDIIGGLGVRELLRSLKFDPENRQLAELGSHQKTKRINKQGRTLKITLDMLIRGSCRISRPFGDTAVMRGYARDGKLTKLRRRLESDIKSLFAIYQYSRLHGAVRLRWGFLDERLPVPWVHSDEPRLYDLMKRAHERNAQLEIVVGTAPGWEDPWSRARRANVVFGSYAWDRWLEDEEGIPFETAEIQLARLVGEDRPHP